MLVLVLLVAFDIHVQRRFCAFRRTWKWLARATWPFYHVIYIIMGACVSRCLQPWLESPNSRKRYTAHYSEHRLAIEVDALLEDDDDDVPLEELTRTRVGVTTELDARDLRHKRYERLGERQREAGADKGRQVPREEEDLRLEEEAYYEAKKAAVRAAELSKEREKAEQTLRDLGSSSQPAFTTEGASLTDWLTEPDGGNSSGATGGTAQQELEDFELFLESVKKRSLSQRSLDKIQVQEPGGRGGDLLGSFAMGSGRQTRDDDFTLFEDSVIPTVTTAQ